MLLLDNPVQPYAWGTTDGIAALVGRPGSGGPEAELWVGTHPRGTSVVAAGPEAGRTLAEVVAGDPERWLGSELAAAGLTGLPYLLKLLAIGSPLSVQAHPSAAQAEEGFAREDAAGIPLDAPHRTYRDWSAKPEALVALVPTDALCGFRSPEAARALVALAGSPSLAPLLAHLDEGTDGLRSALAWVLHLRGDDRMRVAGALAASAGVLGAANPGSAWWWVRQLAATYPGDATALAPLLLEVVHLEPGDAVHLPAGNLHAYLRGAGVEIMAASDNVLRGGLTEKHIDVDELLRVVRFEPGTPSPPDQRSSGRLTTYDANEASFALARIEPGAEPCPVQAATPSILLPLGAAAALDGRHELAIAPGQALFVEPGAAVSITSSAPVWWATTGAGLPG